MFLIVGLGNPGKQYAKTRHNVGFMAVDKISTSYNFNFSEKSKFRAAIATGEIGQHKVILAKPLTYMNLSGESVQLLAHFHKISPANIIVLHDEIDIDFGKIKYKIDGGNAGHNGLKSIDQCLGTKAYHRIRIGVGRPENDHANIADYVLHDFSSDELPTIDILLKSIAENISLILDNKAEEFKKCFQL